MSSTSSIVGGAVGKIRAAIDETRLSEYIAANVAEIDVPVEIRQFSYGQSNPTYFLTDSRGKKFVMRKKPDGVLLSKTAHAVEREYRILDALHEYNHLPSTPVSARIPIPRPLILCKDPSVLSTPFYIMEFLEGRIFADFKMPELAPSERRDCWLSAIQALGKISSLNPDTLGLSDFGPRTAFYPRQLKSLAAVSSAQAATIGLSNKRAVGHIPFFHESLRWYSEHLPDETRFGSRIVHGDYKIDNLVFHPSEPRVIGILDWELCTLGNPVREGRSPSVLHTARAPLTPAGRQLSDLGNLTLPFNFGPAIAPGGYLQSGLLGAPSDIIPIGLEEVEREYCRVMSLNYPIKEMLFVRSWMTFRLAIISQGIAARVALGQASSPNAEEQAQNFPLLGRIARDIYMKATETTPRL